MDGNLYVNFISAAGYALIPIFMISMIVLLGAFTNLLRLKFSIAGLTLLLFFYYFIFLVSTFFEFTPKYPDTLLYSDIIVNNTFPVKKGLGAKLYYYLSYPLRWISMLRLELFIMIQIFIFLLSQILICLEFSILTSNKLDPIIHLDSYKLIYFSVFLGRVI